jgi:hypothetical protein
MEQAGLWESFETCEWRVMDGSIMAQASILSIR